MKYIIIKKYDPNYGHDWYYVYSKFWFMPKVYLALASSLSRAKEIVENYQKGVPKDQVIEEIQG